MELALASLRFVTSKLWYNRDLGPKFQNLLLVLLVRNIESKKKMGGIYLIFINSLPAAKCLDYLLQIQCLLNSVAPQIRVVVVLQKIESITHDGTVKGKIRLQ